MRGEGKREGKGMRRRENEVKGRMRGEEVRGGKWCREKRRREKRSVSIIRKESRSREDSSKEIALPSLSMSHSVIIIKNNEVFTCSRTF